MKQTLLSVIYKSRPLIDPLSSEEQALMDYILLENRKIGVTGFLVRTEEYFYQYLEGSDLTIRELLERIRRNPLHADFQILSEARRQHRNFPRWYMEYFFLTKEEGAKRFENSASDEELAETVLELMHEKASKRGYLSFR